MDEMSCFLRDCCGLTTSSGVCRGEEYDGGNPERVGWMCGKLLERRAHNLLKSVEDCE